MDETRHFLGRVRHHARAIVGFRPGPIPRAAMLRSGLAIDGGFLLFLTFGRQDAAVICAVFTNFLCLSDKADHVVTRVWVQVIGALVFAGLGALGLICAGNEPLILVTLFAFALFAGFVHGTTPGIEAVPRYALCFFVVAAFLPLERTDCVAAVLLGTPVAVATVLLDDYIRHGRRGVHAKLMRASMTYPGPRFSLVYGCAAAVGLTAGLVAGELRPYWVAVTTLVVMQPDRRANTVRVAQRFLGTLAGVVLAFGLVGAMPESIQHVGITLLVIGLPFLWPLGYDRNYGLGVAILCTWVLLVFDFADPGGGDQVTSLFLARLSDTALGCAIALVGSFVVYEASETAAD